jgi:pyridoxamine 5'-phosphate oxidase
MPHDSPLLEAEADPDPLVQFARWYAAAEATPAIRMAEQVALATCAGGRPSVRMVLCKEWDERGFVFHTNYKSRKAGELDAEPRLAALLFHWDPLGRQVRIEGSVSRLSAEESDDYFATRPPRAQLGAWASRQSQPVESRQVLEAAVADMAARYAGGPVPRPEWWGGYRLAPGVIEFWQNRDDRLHDRFVYSRQDAGWSRARLQP